MARDVIFFDLKTKEICSDVFSIEVGAHEAIFGPEISSIFGPKMADYYSDCRLSAQDVGRLISKLRSDCREKSSDGYRLLLHMEKWNSAGRYCELLAD